MWRPLVGLCLLLTGCASPSGGPANQSDEPAAPPEIWALGEKFKERRITNIQPDVEQVAMDIKASPDSVWEALVQVYGDLGIEIAGADIQARALNNPNLALSRRLGGERLSRYLICGSDMSGGFADRFRVQMNILSRVRPAPEGQSTVETTIQAFGINPEGVSNSRVPCTSTHQLEYRIAAAVAELVEG